MNAAPLVLDAILASATDADVAEKLHRLAHRGAVERVTLDAADTARRRLRVTTDKGTDCAIALPRESRLFNGAVLLLDADTRAIVVRVAEEEILRLCPADAAAALELGFQAGNLHWRVRFEDAVLAVLLDGPRDDYLVRLEPLLAAGRLRIDDAS